LTQLAQNSCLSPAWQQTRLFSSRSRWEKSLGRSAALRERGRERFELGQSLRKGGWSGL